MINKAGYKPSSFHDIILNMSLHLQSLIATGVEQTEPLATQITRYLDHLLFKIKQFNHEIEDVKQFLPNLEICDEEDLSTVLRIWCRVISRLATIYTMCYVSESPVITMQQQLCSYYQNH